MTYVIKFDNGSLIQSTFISDSDDTEDEPQGYVILETLNEDGKVIYATSYMINDWDTKYREDITAQVDKIQQDMDSQGE